MRLVLRGYHRVQNDAAEVMMPALDVACVTYHYVESLVGRSLGNDVFKAIRQWVCRPPVLEHCPRHSEIPRIVNRSVPIKEEVAPFICESLGRIKGKAVIHKLLVNKGKIGGRVKKNEMV